jgi:hypothetical protein
MARQLTSPWQPLVTVNMRVNLCRSPPSVLIESTDALRAESGFRKRPILGGTISGNQGLKCP